MSLSVSGRLVRRPELRTVLPDGNQVVLLVFSTGVGLSFEARAGGSCWPAVGHRQPGDTISVTGAAGARVRSDHDMALLVLQMGDAKVEVGGVHLTGPSK